MLNISQKFTKTIAICGFALTATLISSLTSAAEALNLTWTLNNVAFTDVTATATGAFDYDADTNIYSNIALTVSGPRLSTSPAPRTFTTSQLLVGNQNQLFLSFTPAPADILFLTFTSGLSNAGGSRTLIGSASAYGNGGNQSTVTGGTVSATPIPFEFNPAMGLAVLAGGLAWKKLSEKTT
jgi:hypothetical protein